MVSGLTPPSRENDEHKIKEDIAYLRDEIRYAPAARNTSDIGGNFGTNPKGLAALSGQFALSPTECMESVFVTFTENSANTEALNEAGETLTYNVNGWKGKFVYVDEENVGGSAYKRSVILQPTVVGQPDLVDNSSGAFNMTGWAATYEHESAKPYCLVLKSSVATIKTIDDGDPIIKWIFGTHSDGTLLMIKPIEGKTLTLKSGGDIDISSDVTVEDNQFAMLQFSHDAGGKFLLHLGGGSGGSGVGLTDSPTWTGDHVWNGGGTQKFQGDGNDTSQTVVEFGLFGDHKVKFIGEIHGTEDRGLSNPAGGSDIDVPGSDDAISIKSAVIMNTFTLYDLDTLVFSRSVSSTTPAPQNDWVWIEANTGTSGSPNLTGMTYNVPSSKTHQFKVNGTEELVIGTSIDAKNNKIINLGTPTSNYDAATKYFVDSHNWSGADITSGTIPLGRISASSLASSASSSKFLRGDMQWQTVSGGVEADDNITWTGEHIWGTSTGSSNNDEQIFKDTVKFHKDGEDNDYDNNTHAGVEIGYNGNDKCLFNGWITGNGSAYITDPDGGGNIYLESTENSINCHSALVMNTYSIFDLDQLIFSVGDGTDNPILLTNWWGIEVEDSSSTSGGQGYHNLNYNVPYNERHCFNVNGLSQVQIAGGSRIYMNGRSYNNIYLDGVASDSGGLDLKITDGADQTFDFFITSSQSSYLFRIDRYGVKIGSGDALELQGSGYIKFAGNYTGSRSHDTPSKWEKVYVGSTAYYIPLYN